MVILYHWKGLSVDMKKITFFINNMYSDGGTERVVSLIANELSKKYNVDIISLCKTA